MSSEHHAPKSVAPNETLPPVEPPSAGFLIQLFVIPGVIVTAIVLVWLLFTWLASDTGDPRTYLEHLRSNTDKRWHAAVYLASALADSRHEELRYDEAFMADMASVLDESLAAGDTTEQSIMFRAYLCRALGHFRVPKALPTLVKASTKQGDTNDVEVRLSALEAISELADNIRQPLAEKMLPQAAALSRKVADGVAKAPSGVETAEKLRTAATEAELLSTFARNTSDLGVRAARIAELYGPLVEAAERATLSASERDAIDELRSTVTDIARQAKAAAAVDWQHDSPLALAVLRAADETTEDERFDPRLDRRAPYAHLLRERGAFALGVLGGAEAIVKLDQLLSDARPNIRYNAAAGLCRNGVASERCLTALVEMLTKPEVKIDEPDKGFSEAAHDQLYATTRQHVSANGLKAAELLARRNAQADMTRVLSAIESLAANGTPERLRIDAKTMLERIREIRGKA